MKYFLHDSNSFNDEKISMLFIEYGYEGLGLFYTILEKLSQQEKPINTRVLKMQLKVGKKLEKCWSFMEEIEIISSLNGETFSIRLTKFIESMTEKREKTSKRVSEYRDNKSVTENVTRYKDDGNATNITEHNITKQNLTVKKNKEEKVLNISFEVFWDLYDNKKDSKKCKNKWESLSDKQRELAIEDIPKYIKSLPEWQAKKNPYTYLNGECWNDERKEPEEKSFLLPNGYDPRYHPNSPMQKNILIL